MNRPRASRHLKAPLARYANYFEVGHNAFEFLVDFGQFQPDTGYVAVHTRLALGPTHAKLLAGMLEAAVAQHEGEHGAIPEVTDSVDPMDVVLKSLPDFEQRARAVRASAPRPRPQAARSSSKR